MEKIVRTMMDLIASEVCGKVIDRTQYELTDDELVKMYQLAKSHDLAHLVGDALIKNALIANEEIQAKFQNQLLLAVCRYEQLQYELTRLKATLNDAEIPFIPLKGSVIRQYYPEPWMRTSCDIDVLVKEADVSRAMDVLLKCFEGKDITRTHHDISFMTSGNVHIEVHHSLIEGGRIGTAEKLLENIWDYIEPINGSFERLLRDDMFYYYHLAHMAKHLEGGGCGVRPFLDLWLLEHTEHDEEKRVRLLEAGGLNTFAAVACQLAAHWFDGKEVEETALELEKYLIGAGAYGSNENHAAVKQVQKHSKARYLVMRIWMPYRDLKLLYPRLERHPALLPVYELRRWCKLLKPSMFKRKTKELQTISGMSDAKVDRTGKLMSALGLISGK